jgi:hypothetical protein
MTSRRTWERVGVAVIALGSLRGMSQDSRASAMARLAAWNKREMQRLEHKAERLEHKAERQALAVKDAAERITHLELPGRDRPPDLTMGRISPGRPRSNE